MMNNQENILNRIYKFTQDNDIDSGLLQEYTTTRSLKIAFCGTFNAGKSSLINALLERQVLPTRAISSTSAGIEICYSLNEYCVIHYINGTDKQINVSELSEYAMLQNDTFDENISLINLYLNSPILKNDLILIDTPGVEDNEFLTSLTQETIQRADFLFIVVSSHRMFSAQEKNLIFDLYDKLNNNLCFIVNKMDLLDDDDVITIKKKARSYLRNFSNPFLNDNIAFTVADGINGKNITLLTEYIETINKTTKRHTIQQHTRLSHTGNILDNTEYSLVVELDKLNEQLNEIDENYKNQKNKAEIILRNNIIAISMKLSSLRENVDKYTKTFDDLCIKIAKEKGLLSHGNYIAINLLCVLEVVKKEWGNRFMQKLNRMLIDNNNKLDLTFSEKIYSSKQDINDSELVFVNTFDKFIDSYQDDNKYYSAFIFLLAKEKNYLRNEILELLEKIEICLNKSLDHNLEISSNSVKKKIILKFEKNLQKLKKIREFREEIRGIINLNIKP